MVLITMSALFTQSLNQIQAIAISVITASFTIIPALLVSTLVKRENKILKILGVTIFVAFMLLCMYACLTVAALMGLD